MVFTILIAIVFIAELIIALTIILNLVKLNRLIIKTDLYLTDVRPKIKEISALSRGISEQFLELTPMWVESFKKFGHKIILSKLESLISLFLFWGFNKKMAKLMRRSKFLRFAAKGLSFVQHVL